MRVVLLFAAILVATVAVTDVAVMWFEGALLRQHPGSPPTDPGDTEGFGSAENWLHPKEDLARLRAHEDQNLNTAGWLDPKHTVAHIPIDDAMRLYVRQSGDVQAPSANSKPSPAVPTERRPE